MFGAQASTPAFGTPSFGTPSSTPAFGTPSATPAFGTPSSTPAFGAPSSTPAFGTPSTSSFGSSLFSTPFSSQPQQQQQQQQQTPGFQQPATPFTGFGFQTPSATPQPQQQPSPFPNAQLTTQMAPVAPLPFSLADRDIQAIVDAYKDEPTNPKYAFKHLLFSVTDPQFRVKPAGVSDIMWAEAMGKLEGMDNTDRERLWPQLVQGFKDLSHRLKKLTCDIIVVVSVTFRIEIDILRLSVDGYPSQLNLNLGASAAKFIRLGFVVFTPKERYRMASILQDDVIVSDAERLRITQSNVKMLQRHFQAETLPWIQRMRQKEQSLQRRLLRVGTVSALLLNQFRCACASGHHAIVSVLNQFRIVSVLNQFRCARVSGHYAMVMRIIEALEGKGCRLPLMKGEAELAEKLAAITRQLKGSGAELSRRVQNLLTVSHVQANGIGAGGSVYLPGSSKIHEQSLADMQEVLHQQTEAIARLGNVLKRDVRDMEIIMAEDTEMAEDVN
ncbi:hypothetical protein JRO89_XSUnG0152000 [Xanthoceras sorbifolium]|uniref:Nucleoporin Nup54 alpha-helical domain-containing protein n=1 Tax=Xanthoceras sorbifolium TaxID=99658 RepID=A0ABQ8GXX5_9ROSI|nr:hypothetical protein JRO89_XSUnG0152000 [Xanthoceras sorbifolium]